MSRILELHDNLFIVSIWLICKGCSAIVFPNLLKWDHRFSWPLWTLNNAPNHPKRPNLSFISVAVNSFADILYRERNKVNNFKIIVGMMWIHGSWLVWCLIRGAMSCTFLCKPCKMKQVFRFSYRHQRTVTLQNAQLIKIRGALILETKVALNSRCFVTKSVLGIYIEIFLVINAEWMFSWWF